MSNMIVNWFWVLGFEIMLKPYFLLLNFFRLFSIDIFKKPNKSFENYKHKNKKNNKKKIVSFKIKIKTIFRINQYWLA